MAPPVSDRRAVQRSVDDPVERRTVASRTSLHARWKTAATSRP